MSITFPLHETSLLLLLLLNTTNEETLGKRESYKPQEAAATYIERRKDAERQKRVSKKEKRYNSIHTNIAHVYIG